MVEYPHVHQGEGVLQALVNHNPQVCLAPPEGWLRAKMTAAACSSRARRTYFARMHAGTVDGAPKELFAADYAVVVVEKQAGKDLAGLVVQLGLEVGARRFRAGQPDPAP